MSERKDQLIGARFTEKEKKVIETIAEKRNLTLTKFLREAIFSHINHLMENVGNINIDLVMTNFEILKNSIERVEKCIKNMESEFEGYELSRLKFNLLKSAGAIEN